jgi:hypothetical protein
VKLFFFGMSSSFSAGNDFVDNYTYGRWRNGERAGEVLANTAGQEPTLSLAARVIGWQSRLLEHSNLVRFAKFHWGPLLRSLLLADPGQERMADALMYTDEGFAELDELSRDIGFEYSVYLIVPVQDIIRGTHGQTLATLNRVSRTPAVSTATLFVAAPQQFYYAYEGHLNTKGSRRISRRSLFVPTMAARRRRRGGHARFVLLLSAGEGSRYFSGRETIRVHNHRRY